MFMRTISARIAKPGNRFCDSRFFELFPSRIPPCVSYSHPLLFRPMKKNLPPRPQLNRVKATVSYPGEAREIVADRMRKLGFEKFTDYVVSLIAYDLWAERKHLYTGQAAAAGGAEEWDLWREIVRDYGLPPEEKTGSYFEHLLERRRPPNGATPGEGDAAERCVRLARELGRTGASMQAGREATEEEVEQYFIQNGERLIERARLFFSA
jgi:hypothetical protein